MNATFADNFKINFFTFPVFIELIIVSIAQNPDYLSSIGQIQCN